MRPSGSLPATTAFADTTGVMPSSCSAIFSAQAVASRAPSPCSSEGSLCDVGENSPWETSTGPSKGGEDEE